LTLVNGIWYDNELKYGYGEHSFILAPNSDGISIVKCAHCLQTRMYLQLMDMTSCKSVGVDG
jgi:hypothetical protein